MDVCLSPQWKINAWQRHKILSVPSDWRGARHESNHAMDGSITHLVKWRSLASMLRCRMHIRVKAEPISLVAPDNKTNER